MSKSLSETPRSNYLQQDRVKGINATETVNSKPTTIETYARTMGSGACWSLEFLIDGGGASTFIRFSLQMRLLKSGHILIDRMERLVHMGDMASESLSLAPFIEMDMSKIGHASIQVHGQRQPSLSVHPHEDNPDAFALDIGGPSTCSELKVEASAGHLDFRLDNIEFKLNHMDSRLDRVDFSFTVELSIKKKLVTVLVARVS
ncbi:protein SPIRRIG [Cucumis melo var. makuwa]|uniref:Protein SPIRRIG n=1 Tax=Cucumis melo var. makuwa TaxID=1194695 RepID=A0A5A7SJV4_CUCMM|nr:protein SPIRRIG [Cucumis melo var. makuwa]TYJ96341.1 protein SPIRRIG [Cucumis melo var. makuwa]